MNSKANILAILLCEEILYHLYTKQDIDRVRAKALELLPEIESPCEWYGHTMNRHDWIRLPWGIRCAHCKLDLMFDSPENGQKNNVI